MSEAVGLTRSSDGTWWIVTLVGVDPITHLLIGPADDPVVDGVFTSLAVLGSPTRIVGIDTSCMSSVQEILRGISGDGLAVVDEPEQVLVEVDVDEAMSVFGGSPADVVQTLLASARSAAVRPEGLSALSDDNARRAAVIAITARLAEFGRTRVVGQGVLGRLHVPTTDPAHVDGQRPWRLAMGDDYGRVLLALDDELDPPSWTVTARYDGESAQRLEPTVNAYWMPYAPPATFWHVDSDRPGIIEILLPNGIASRRRTGSKAPNTGGLVT